MKKANGGTKRPRPRPAALAKVFVAGYKSFADAAEIEIRPLTLLAGANSSGKSSIMQPLLLMKQTFEAPYDPGGLRLDGPHVKLTDAEQMFWGVGTTKSTGHILFGFELDDGLRVEQSCDLDPAGAFGDWPEDFAEVDLGAQRAYLDASDRRRNDVSRAKNISSAREKLQSPEGTVT